MSVNKAKRWSHLEDLVIKERYPNDSTKDIARDLKRTVYSIRNRAIALGVKKSKEYMIDNGLKSLEVDGDALADMYLAQGMSIPDIAAKLNLSKSTTRLKLIKQGVTLRSRADGLRAVGHKLGLANRGKKRVFTKEWKANMKKAAIKRGDKSASGISYKSHSGYLEITRGVHKGKRYHRVVVESHIGRRLKDDEVVHHKDGNKLNNKLCNLQVMTASEHARLHALENLNNRKRNKYGQFK